MKIECPNSIEAKRRSAVADQLNKASPKTNNEHFLPGESKHLTLNT